MKHQHYSKGTYIYKIHERSNKFFGIIRGSVSIRVRAVPISQAISPNSSFVSNDTIPSQNSSEIKEDAITENDINKTQEYITIYNRFLDIKKNHYRITKERNTKKMCGEKISFKEKWMYFKYNLYYNFRTKNLGRKMGIIW